MAIVDVSPHVHGAGFATDIDLTVEADSGVGNIIDCHIDRSAVGLSRRLYFQPMTSVEEEIKEQTILCMLGGAAGDGVMGVPLEGVLEADPGGVVLVGADSVAEHHDKLPVMLERRGNVITQNVGLRCRLADSAVAGRHWLILSRIPGDPVTIAVDLLNLD